MSVRASGKAFLRRCLVASALFAGLSFSHAVQAQSLLWQNNANGQLSRWRMNGESLAQSSGVFNQVTDTNWKIAAEADVRQDGNNDFIWQNQRTGQLAYWYMNDTQLLSSVAFATVSDTNWKVVAAADMNGDGHPDLIWQNQRTGQLAYWYMNDTQLLSSVAFATVSDTNWKVVTVSDIDGDGHPDLVWQNGSTGAVSIWYMNNTQFLSSSGVLTTVADTNWKIVAAPDYNGDGHPDLLWRNARTGQVAAWYLNNTQILGYSSLIATVDTSWNIVAAVSGPLNPNPTPAAPSSPAPPSDGGTPSAVAALVTAGDTVNFLSWSPATVSSATITGYSIYRATDPSALTSGQGTLIKTVPAGVNVYTDADPGLTPGTTYYYGVAALSSTGNYSNDNVFDAATVGGAQTLGILGAGDPPSQHPAALFTAALFDYTTSASRLSDPNSSHITVSVTLDPARLGHTPTAADLQGIVLNGTALTRAKTPGFANGVSVSGNTLTFSTTQAGLSLASVLPYGAIAAGSDYSITALVAAQKLTLTAGQAPQQGTGKYPTVYYSQNYEFDLTNNS